MRKTTLAALMGGLMLSSGMAMAAVAAPAASLTTSENLAGKYSLTDSGFYNFTGMNSIGMMFNNQNTTTNTVLRTYQSGSSWYQDIRTDHTYSYDQQVQDFSQQRRMVSLSVTTPVAGDQWFDFSVDTNGPLSYNASIYGNTGTKTSPRGLSQTVLPGWDMKVNDATPAGAYSFSNFMSGGMSGTNWYASSGCNGGCAANGTVKAMAEATDGGSLKSFTLTLEGARVVGDTRIQQYSNTHSNYSTLQITTPVPEPETWAMLLAGLGMMGAVARRRRATRG